MNSQRSAERDWRLLLGARGGALVIRLLAATWRIHVVNPDVERGCRGAGRRVVFALWHGQILPLLWHHRNQGISVLISEHRDGEVLARIAMALGYRVVRGSTTRGAGRALISLVRELKDGHDVAVTPDGPRGPAKSFAAGALVAAQRGDAAVLPIAAYAVRAWRLRSWDRHLVPKPFARVVVAYGPPTRVEGASPREAEAQAPRFARLIEEATERAGG